MSGIRFSRKVGVLAAGLLAAATITTATAASSSAATTQRAGGTSTTQATQGTWCWAPDDTPFFRVSDMRWIYTVSDTLVWVQTDYGDGWDWGVAYGHDQWGYFPSADAYCTV